MKTNFVEGSPVWHLEQAKIHVERATKVLKQGIDAGGDREAVAVMAMASEVLGGLTRAFTHFTYRSEGAQQSDES